MVMERQWPALPEPTPESLARWAAEITRLLRQGDIASGATVDALDALFLTPAEGDAAYQPLDSDLTAIAALVTSAFGRSLLTQANAAAALATLTAAGQGKQTIWVPASAMTPRTTNGPAFGTAETTTNRVMRTSLDYDGTTQEFAQFAIAMPKNWDEGTFSFEVVWSHAATTTNFGVAWQLQGIAFSNDDGLDATAFGASASSVDTGGTTDDVYISPEGGPMTPAGTAAEKDYVVFQIKRNLNDAGDNMAIDARLHGVRLHYTTNAATDA
jgi:hypothetical protein